LGARVFSPSSPCRVARASPTRAPSNNNQKKTKKQKFGEVGIDDALIVGQGEGEEILELNNGCVCCTVRGDLIRILTKLRQRRHGRGEQLDGVVIETTGLADPAPVAQTFFVDDEIAEHYRLDAIVTVVDARHLALHLDDKQRTEGCENEAAEQLAFADTILLNKRDLVTDEEAAVVRTRIRGINAAAPIHETTRSKIHVDQILGIGAFELSRVLEAEPEFLKQDPGEHQHDDTVTSVGIERAGECDIGRLNEWLSILLREKGADIFRSKGVFAISGSPHRHVFQGVHMLLSFGSSAESDPAREDTTGALRPWAKDEPRVNKLIFIGRNLDRAALEESFATCLVRASGRLSSAAAASAAE
jgi:G3E family GTPase